MSSHAKLSASGSAKWLVCTPSAELEATLPDEQSSFAAEGAFAHEVFEHIMRGYLGEHIVDLRPFKNSPHWSVDLFDHVTSAAERAKALIDEARASCPDALILLEQRLDYSPWVSEGFGTGDLVIVADDTLIVADLKMGRGVYVDAQDNSQFRLYALGAYNQFSMLYDISQVRMVTLQPRLNNWSESTIPSDELLQWAADVVTPAAELAFKGEGSFNPGEHCSSGFCKARFTCRARAEANLELARAEFALNPPTLLSTAEVAQILATADQLSKWAADVQAWAFKEAEAGRTVPGWKLVAGKSSRRIADPNEAAARLIDAGLRESDIFQTDLLGITALEKLLGKGRFAEVLDGLIAMSEAKATLVPVSDKRPELPARTSAAEDFKEPAAGRSPANT